MSGAEPFTVILPSELAEVVRAKVATGEYATESDMIQEGLNALLARDHAVEQWLLDEVGPASDALKANSSRAISVADVRVALATEYERAMAGR